MNTRTRTGRSTVGGVLGLLLAVPLLAVPLAATLSAVVPSAPAEALATGGDQIAYTPKTAAGPYYAYHTFTSNGTFTVPAGQTLSVSYTIVGGGGGGGSFFGGATGAVQAGAGGGGGGGFRSGTVIVPATVSATDTTFPAVVGAGGAPDTNGGGSSWNGVTTLGGGHGASVNKGPTTADDAPAASAAGIVGSGGGGRCGAGVSTGGLGTTSPSPAQGQRGGSAPGTCTVLPEMGATNSGAGGGGSTGGANVTGPNLAGGNGGKGSGAVLPKATFGGGGGGGASKSGSIITGGLGGDGSNGGFPPIGGNIGNYSGGRGANQGTALTDAAGNGVGGYLDVANNTGGGGGGGGGGNFQHPEGGRGGSGVVILRYQVGFLTYNANNGAGTVPADSPYLANGDSTTVATPIAMSRTGYTFTGWHNAANPPVGTVPAFPAGANYTAPASPAKVTLYAQWAAHHYQVAFVANGGVGAPMADQAFTFDVAANLTPNAFTRAGYTFKGWTVAENGTGTVYPDGASVRNLTANDGETVQLYAQWTPTNYSVEFEAPDGSGSMDPQPFVYDVAEDLTANQFSRTGYRFDHWKADDGTTYTDQQSVSKLTSVPGGVVTMAAQWAPINYTVSFAGNGGARSMPGQKFAYGTPQALAANTFVRSGFAFAGWNTTADGSGTSYPDRAVVNNLTTVDGATVQLYALWTKDDTSAVPHLPDTGGPSRWLLLLGLLLLAGGVLALVSQRRR